MPSTIRPRLVSRIGADADVALTDRTEAGELAVAGPERATADSAAVARLAAADRAMTLRSVRATRQVVRSVLTVLAKVSVLDALAKCSLLSVAAEPAAADGPASAPPPITESGGRCRLG
jgi:hypothetical protein